MKETIILTEGPKNELNKWGNYCVLNEKANSLLSLVTVTSPVPAQSECSADTCANTYFGCLVSLVNITSNYGLVWEELTSLQCWISVENKIPALLEPVF